jgi:putative flippase GtrA
MKVLDILSKQNNTRFQFLRYSISGGIAFISDFTLLYILTDFFHIYYLVSAGIAFMAGVLITYILSITWVFDKRRIKNKHLELGFFILISFIGLILTELFIWFFTEKINFHYLISKIISSALVLFWNFFSKKYILFSSKY